MDLHDPKVQRLLFSSLISALCLYLFFGTSLMGFTFQSQRSDIAELETEHEKLSRELERARLIVGNMAKLEREFDYLHRQWQVAQSLLPDENEISPLLRNITAAGTQAGLSFVRFEPKPALQQGFYTENPVSVRIEGGYHQLGTFVSQLANLNRIINIRNLDIRGVQPESQEESDHTLEASMEIVAYSMDASERISSPADVGNGSQELTGADATVHPNLGQISQTKAKLEAAREKSTKEAK